LEDVDQDLTRLAKQGMVDGFFNNIKNADKLDGLVEDIRDAIVEYQVRSLNHLFLPYLIVHVRLRYNKISTTKVASLS